MAIYLCGSQGKGSAQADSDLDLALLAPGYIDSSLLGYLANDLATLVDCEVDLLDLRRASTVMQHQVISTGRTVFDTDLPVRLLEVAVLSEKIALDEARLSIEWDSKKHANDSAPDSRMRTLRHLT